MASHHKLERAREKRVLLKLVSELVADNDDDTAPSSTTATGTTRPKTKPKSFEDTLDPEHDRLDWALSGCCTCCEKGKGCCWWTFKKLFWLGVILAVLAVAIIIYVLVNIALAKGPGAVTFISESITRMSTATDKHRVQFDAPIRTTPPIDSTTNPPKREF